MDDIKQEITVLVQTVSMPTRVTVFALEKIFRYNIIRNHRVESPFLSNAHMFLWLPFFSKVVFQLDRMV
jgi:aminopeptidase C